VSGDDDFAVRLNGNRTYPVVRSQNRIRDLAEKAERRIERTVRVVADDGEIFVRAAVAVTGGENFAVRLQKTFGRRSKVLEGRPIFKG
jgi:hypothetical protein